MSIHGVIERLESIISKLKAIKDHILAIENSLASLAILVLFLQEFKPSKTLFLLTTPSLEIISFLTLEPIE